MAVGDDMSQAAPPKRSLKAPNWLHRYQLESVLRSEIASSLKGKRGLRILDLGCGGKQYESYFGKTSGCYIGSDVEATEMSDVVCVGEHLPFSGELFDVVLCTQVLEHVTEPALVLEEIARVLKPEGVLFLSTHGTFPYHPTPVDYWRWTQSGLRKVVENARLRAVRMLPVGGTFSTLAMLNVWYFNILAEKVLTRIGPLAWVLRPLKQLAVAGFNGLGILSDRLLPGFGAFDRPNTIFLGFVIVAKSDYHRSNEPAARATTQ